MQCEICGAKLAESEKGLAHHMRRYHGVWVKRTGRTTHQIVADWERRHSRHVISFEACKEGCQCQSCFQRQLDALLERSDKLAGNNESF